MDKSINQSKRSKFLKNHVNSIIFFVLLTVIVSVITYYRILVQIDMGPLSDSVVFLANALVFAGQGTGYSDLLRPPFFPFIISLFFRLGYTSAITIFAVDGGLFVFGVVGLFLLLKISFNDLESFLGALLYATFPIILTILSVGFSDLASVSFSIWAFYFLVLAVKKDSRFFYLAFPFFMITFLTRYNNALLIFPIILYILMNKERVNFKHILIGITASIMIIVPVLIFFYEKFGNIIYPFINSISTSTIVSVSTDNTSYNPNTFYFDPNIFFFLQKFPALVGIQGMIILLIIALGILLYFYLKVVKKDSDNKNFLNKLNLRSTTPQIKWILFVVLGILFLGSFGKTFYILSEIIFFAIVYLFYDITRNLKLKNIKLHILFLTWFMTFFIFHSVFVIKDIRYFVVMAPPVAYFMILGLSEISKLIKFKVKNRNITFILISIILIIIMITSAVSQITGIEKANGNDFNKEIEMASIWLEGYDPEYRSKNIYSDFWPNFSWYLKTNVKKVPLFNDNYILNQSDTKSFNQYLLNNNADYYISVRQNLNLTSYEQIKQFGFLNIYKKRS